MRNAILAFLVMTLAPQAGALGKADPNAPRIESAPLAVGTVVLGPAVSAALLKHDALFKMYEAHHYIPAVRELFEVDSPNETPMAVTGDFNGDKKTDIVLMGYSGKFQLILAAVSQEGGSYKIVEVARGESTPPEQTFFPELNDDDDESDEHESQTPRQQGLYEYLSFVPANTKVKGTKDRVQRFPNDAFQLEIFRGPDARLYFYKNGKFPEFVPKR